LPLSAAIFAGRLAAGGGALGIARAVEALPRAAAPGLSDLLLEGLLAFDQFRIVWRGASLALGRCRCRALRRLGRHSPDRGPGSS